jgi:hypothetical protein
MKPSSQSPDPLEDSNDLESLSHTFVLKVWVEEFMEESRVARWRGRITHVLNNDYIYFEDLETLHTFLKKYLDKLNLGPASQS